MIKSTIIDTRGFTLIEVMLVIAIIGVLASIAIPSMAVYSERARTVSCLVNRKNIETDEIARLAESLSPSLNPNNAYQCPINGIYVWLVTDPEDPDYPKVACSIHFASTPDDLDPQKKGLDQIKGLVAGFTLDGGSGNTVSVGDQEGQIYGGAQWVEGKSGNALKFDGKDDYVKVDLEDWSGPFTVMSWVQGDPVKHDKYDSVFSSSANGPKKDNFQIDSDGKGNYRFHGGVNNSDINIGKISSDWQLIAVTFDGANVSTYNNGVFVDSGTWSGEAVFTDYVLGRNRNGNKKFTGTIDELGVYNRAVSNEEIQAYYNQTK
jgi:prepilin-type N-terminal cleavage/methylation domain-containing protein